MRKRFIERLDKGVEISFFSFFGSIYLEASSWPLFLFNFGRRGRASTFIYSGPPCGRIHGPVGREHHTFTST